MDSFQTIILKLKAYWAERGCIIQEPFDVEVGADVDEVGEQVGER